jgi:hypothetical protein
MRKFKNWEAFIPVFMNWGEKKCRPPIGPLILWAHLIGQLRQ